MVVLSRNFWARMVIGSLAAAAPASALVIQPDYSLDSMGFFSSNPAAKSAIDTAAADISAVITTSLAAISTDTFAGSSGGTTATFRWDLTVTNPTTGVDVTFDKFNLPSGTVRLYVGMSNLTGTSLGQGGPSSAGFQLSGSGAASGWVNAVAAAQTNSNNGMGRGDGPIIGTLSGSASLGGTPANYSLGFGSLMGSLTLDSDTDNNGITDNAATLASFWHYDPLTPVAAGKTDMYSVALHEILHAIGFGLSDSWDGHANGNNWSGSNVIALRGSGNGLITGGGHIAAGTMSTRLSDGAAQEAVMDPSLTIGTRKTLTALDAAFLRDMGWDTVPEPGTAALWLGAVVPMMMFRRRPALRSGREW